MISKHVKILKDQIFSEKSGDSTFDFLDEA